jgi:hypothetical protein
MGHVEALKVEFPKQAGKIFLLSEMSGQPYSVHDPYGEPLLAFQKMAAELAGLMDSGIEKIIRLANENAKRDKASTSLQ